MLDSTARAERVDLTTPEAACFTWEVAQKPVTVRLPLPLIDRLESEAVETFRSLTSRGSEIGGLLLGTHAPGNPSMVTVSDFELVPCDYTRGPLYRLADGDLARFEKTMERLAANNGARVIGFFRSHTRKGLALDAEDLAFFEPRFLEPHHIVVLIRPFATKVSTAGIFIRENGRLGGEHSYREFPFRSSELFPAGGPPAEKSETMTLSTPAAQPSAPPKPQARAQIVPIASRREIVLPEAVVAAVPTITPAIAEPAEPAAPSEPPTPKPQPAISVVEVVEKEEKPKEKEPEREKPAVTVAKAVEAPVEAAPVSPAAEIALPGAPRKSKKLRLVVAAAIAMLALGGGLIFYPSLMKRFTARSSVAPQDSSPLSLRVERTSGGMLLTWNRDLPVIQSATKVVLSISDGDQHENIELDPNQVRTGSILYPPITGDVSFQMQVTDAHQSKTTSESLRVLDPRPSPLDAPANPTPAGVAATKDNPAVKPNASETPVTTAASPAATTPADDAKPVDETPTPAPVANLKPFNAASLAQRLRPPSPTDLSEPPPTVRATPVTSGSLTGLINNQTVVPAPPKPVTPAPVPPPAVGGQLIPARVIAKVEPEYPKLARQAGAGGLVELEATISADGKVRNPRVVRGNSMLQKAAIDAVLQWRYQPALLNGKPVDSPVEIKLNFVAQGH